MGRNLAPVLRAARIRGAALAAACCLLPGLALGQALPRNDGVSSSYGSGRTRITAPSANGYWIPSVDGTNVRLSTSGPIAAPGGRSANATVYKTLTAAGSGGWKRLLAHGARALPLIGTGLVLWDLLNDFGARPDGQGGLQADAGVSPVSSPRYCWDDNGVYSTCYPSAKTYLEAAYASHAQYGTVTVTVTNQQETYAISTVCTPLIGCASGLISYRYQDGTTTACPDGSAVRPDGKCSGGVMSPATEADVELMLAQLAATDPRVIPAIDAALDLSPFPFSDPYPVVDPASLSPISADPVTTTGPNGTKTEQTTYDPEPNGPGVVEWTATTTTTTTDPNGNTTTETKTETPEPTDPCELFPDRLSCMDAGSADGPQLDNEQKTVAITPQSGFGADNAACPAPVSMTVLGQPITTDNTLMCQFATGIRPVVIAVAWLVAALIVIGVRTSGD